MAIGFRKETVELGKFTESFFEIPNFVSSSADFYGIEGDMLFSKFGVFISRDSDLIN